MLLTYLNIEFSEKRYGEIPNQIGGAEWFSKDKSSLGLDFPNCNS